MVHLEQIVLRVIQIVLSHTVMGELYRIKVVLEGWLYDWSVSAADFYEEILNLVESLTTSQISAPMWEVYKAVYEMFKHDGMTFFTGVFRFLSTKSYFLDSKVSLCRRYDALFAQLRDRGLQCTSGRTSESSYYFGDGSSGRFSLQALFTLH